MLGTVIGERRHRAERLLNILKSEWYSIMDSDAQDHVDYLWIRRHIHWSNQDTERLEQIAESYSISDEVKP